MRQQNPGPTSGSGIRIFIRARAASAAFAMLLMIAGISDAAAHSRRTGPSGAEGLSFPGLTHGEMAVLAPYSKRIANLARSATLTDPVFRRLVNFRAIQFSYCGWGIAPGAISDEKSPFNECSHAYLSADKALLLHMRTMTDLQSRADALVSEIEATMVLNGAAFIGCMYSGELFNTAEHVTPHWENIPRHWPTAALLSAAIIVPVTAGIGLQRRNRTGASRRVH